MVLSAGIMLAAAWETGLHGFTAMRLWARVWDVVFSHQVHLILPPPPKKETRFASSSRSLKLVDMNSWLLDSFFSLR